MKKVMVIMFLLLFALGIVLAADYGNGNSGNSDDNSDDLNDSEDSDNSNSGDNSNDSEDEDKDEDDSEVEIEIESETEFEAEYENGTKVKFHSEQKIKSHYTNQSECPINCACSGSTVKCSFENGTREMTIYAGNSGNIIVQVKSINASTNVTLYKSDGKVFGIFEGNKTKEIILPDEVKEKIQNRTKVKLHNESMELNEEGNYEYKAKKEAKLLWMISTKEKTKFVLDAETGEITKEQNPLWGFLAKDVEE